MKQYHDLLNHILQKGTRKLTRAKLLSTGALVDAISVFGYQTRYDLSEGFPLLTTKKVNFHAVLHELIWFLRGDTNIKYLTDNNVHIWDEWADAQGNLGKVYGAQWRSWEQGDGQTLDQIQKLIDGIRMVVADPTASVGRRLIVTAWNPAQIECMALPPCHCLFQFMVTEGKLSCQLYQRSADAFLGVPFNIASYALLTHLVAAVTGLEPGEFIHTFGDLHIYTNHLEQVQMQLTREAYELPTVIIDKSVTDITQLEAAQVSLHNYKCHGPIKGEVAV